MALNPDPAQVRSEQAGSHATATASLATPAVAAFSWNLAGGAGRAVAGFAINIALARLLGPEPFGLIAVAMLVVSFGNLVVDSGLGSGLVQKRDLHDDDVSFVFALQTALGIALAGIVVALAPVLAHFFGQPEVGSVLRAVSLVLLFDALGQTSKSLLKRELAFRRVQEAQITSYLVGYLLLGLPLAFAGLGVWSLVVALVTQSACNAGYLYAHARHPLRLRFTPSGPLLRFGGNILGANLLNWSQQNFDTLLIGRYFSAVTLGFYNRTLFLTSTPVGLLVGALQTVVFSLTSKVQSEPARVRRVFLGLLQLTALVACPMLLGLAAVSRTAIEGVFGSEWLPAAHLLPPLSLMMIAQALLSLAGPVMNGLGRPDVELRQTVWGALLVAAALLVAGRYSVEAMAWAVFGSRAALFVLLTHPALRLLEASWWDVLAHLARSLGFGAVVAVSLWLMDATLSGVGLGAVARLAIEMATGATFLGAAVLAGQGWLVGREGTRLLWRIAPLERLFRRARLAPPVTS